MKLLKGHGVRGRRFPDLDFHFGGCRSDIIPVGLAKQGMAKGRGFVERFSNHRHAMVMS